MSTSDSGAAATYTANNHRSWHPVMDDTGRTAAVRGGLPAANFRLPWSNAIGTQTMYCTDCHGSSVSSSNSVIPDGDENGNPWGPHGSSIGMTKDPEHPAFFMELVVHSPCTKIPNSKSQTPNRFQYPIDQLPKRLEFGA